MGIASRFFCGENQVDVQGQLREKIDQITSRQGLSVVEATLAIHGGTHQIRIVVDKTGGVLLGDCAKINRALRKYIEEAQFLENNFTIEVSSPGLDRKFTKIDDFIRCIGRRINVATRQPIAEECEFCGKITAAADEQIELLLDTDQTLTINLNNIKKAKLEIGWKR